MFGILDRYIDQELISRFRKIFEVLEIDFYGDSSIAYVKYTKSQSTAEECLLFFILTLYYPRENEFEDFRYVLKNEDELSIVKRYFWSNTFAEFYCPESKSFCDVTETSRAPYNTGIQRVTRKIFMNRPTDVHGFAWDRERFAPKSLTESEEGNLLNWGSLQQSDSIVRIGKMQYQKNLITKLIAYTAKFSITRSTYHLLRTAFNVDAYAILSRYFDLKINNRFLVFYKVQIFTTELFYLDQDLISIYINLMKNRLIEITALVHDAIPVSFPQYVASPTIAGYMHILRLYSYANQLMTPTSSEREVVVKALEIHGNCDREIVVLPLSGDSFIADPVNSTKFEVAEIRILILGSLDPRKNQLGMLRAIKDLRSKVNNRIIVNVVAGGEWMSDAVRKELIGIDKLGIDCKLHISISDQELYEILRNSSFLFFASHGEGFGLPIAEAGLADIPVLTSNLGAMKEVATLYCPRYLLTDPTNIEVMAASLLDAVNERWKVGSAPLRSRTWKSVASDFYFGANLPKGKPCSEGE